MVATHCKWVYIMEIPHVNFWEQQGALRAPVPACTAPEKALPALPVIQKHLASMTWSGLIPLSHFPWWQSKSKCALKHLRSHLKLLILTTLFCHAKKLLNVMVLCCPPEMTVPPWATGSWAGCPCLSEPSDSGTHCPPLLRVSWKRSYGWHSRTPTPWGSTSEPVFQFLLPLTKTETCLSPALWNDFTMWLHQSNIQTTSSPSSQIKKPFSPRRLLSLLLWWLHSLRFLESWLRKKKYLRYGKIQFLQKNIMLQCSFIFHLFCAAL